MEEKKKKMEKGRKEMLTYKARTKEEKKERKKKDALLVSVSLFQIQLQLLLICLTTFELCYSHPAAKN